MKYSTIRCVICAFASSAAVSFGGAVQFPGDSKLKRELDAKLPAESRHTFPAVNNEWIKTIRFYDPVLGDEYDAETVSDEQKKRFGKIELFSMSGKKEGDYRVVTYSPAGKLVTVEDRRGDDEYQQSFYADGNISGYMHRRKDKVLEAYSVDADGRNVRRVSRGSGILEWHLGEPKDFTRKNAYHEGELYFSGEYTAKKLNMVWLVTKKDKLMRWRNGSEEFFIDNERTWWGRDLKGKIELRRLDGVYVSKIDPDRVKLWEGKYGECLDAFFNRYEAVLKSAGSSWEKLDIEFIPKNKPFPGE